MPLFEKSQKFTVMNGNFIDVTNIHNHSFRTGFDRLEEASLPQALRDSSDREIPRCHPGTREGHLQSITSWGWGEWRSRRARVLWIKGPAGVGKSAIAQTWAEALEDKFAAAFFFSRANQWNQPEKFIPTIAYQLATRFPSYRTAVDTVIALDPFVLKKSVTVQFKELIMEPLRELTPDDRMAIENAIIVIDGLDECSSVDAQQTIIDVITTSAASATTPFLWAFFTRPEPHIISAFSSTEGQEVCWRLTLDISRDIDNDIKAYLRDGFGTIRTKHGFSDDVHWPLKEDLAQLVNQCDGLFVYATSAIRFIADPGSEDSSLISPEERLRTLLDAVQGPRSHLSKLDQLYLLIMDQIPKNVLPTTLLVLSANCYFDLVFRDTPTLSSILGLSPSGLNTSIRALHSVLNPLGGRDFSIAIYHASFTDFLTTVERSTPEYCISTPHVCNRLYSACINAIVNRPPMPVEEGPDRPDGEGKKIAAHNAAMILLIQIPGRMNLRLDNEPDVLEDLTRIEWHLATARRAHRFQYTQESVEAFIQKIPAEWRPRIINPFREGLSSKLRRKALGRGTKRSGYVLGRGSNRVFLECDSEDYYFEPCPDLSFKLAFSLWSC